MFQILAQSGDYYYSTNSYYENDTDVPLLVYAIVGVMFVFMYLATSFLLMKLAQKLKMSSTLQVFCWIPILNLYTQIEMSRLGSSWFIYILGCAFLSAIPCLGLIFAIIMLYLEIKVWMEIAKRFKQSPLLSLLQIIPFGSIILMLILLSSKEIQD